MNKKIKFLWEHFKFHSKNILLIVAGIFFIVSFLGWYLQKILLVESLNLMLIAALVGVTSLYSKATDRLVELNGKLIEESQKSRRRDYLEKKLEKIYVPLYEYFVIDEKKYINGDDRIGLFLGPELGTIVKKNIVHHLYLADEKLRKPLRKILKSDGKHKVDKTTYYNAKQFIDDGLNKYTKELEEITKSP